MTALPPNILESTQENSGTQRSTKVFSILAAIVLIIFSLWGFRHFYFSGQAYPGRPLTVPIRSLIITHAITMSAWMILLLVQPILIAVGKRSLHRILGIMGACLALVIVVVGLRLGVASIQIMPPGIQVMGFSPPQFLMVPVSSVLLFGFFVAIGIWKRQDTPVHRAMMLLATLAAVAAAMSRIDSISQLYQQTLWDNLFGPFFSPLILAVLMLIPQSIITRSFDRIYAWGCVGMTIYFGLAVHLARTDLWEGFAMTVLGG